jgi:hypothetical protein
MPRGLLCTGELTIPLIPLKYNPYLSWCTEVPGVTWPALAAANEKHLLVSYSDVSMTSVKHTSRCGNTGRQYISTYQATATTAP